MLLCVAAQTAVAQSAPVLRVSLSAAGSSGVVRLDWSAVNGVTLYQVRRTNTFPTNWFTFPSLYSTLSVSDSMPANTVAVYQVTPVNGSGVPIGPSSNYAMASNYAYAAPIVAGATVVAASHVTELRSVTGAVRSGAGLPVPAWFQPSLASGSPILRQDVEELRAAFDGIANALFLPPPSYVDAGSLQSVPVRAIHMLQLRAVLRSYPETTWVSFNVTNPYFSPNADGAKDTTLVTAVVTFAAASQHPGFRWLLNIRNSSNTVVRSTSGTGTSIAYTWDGRNASGAVQPDGAYSLEVIDLDSQTPALGSAVATIDNTAPAAAISAPAAGAVISNVRQNGSGDVTVTGSATDVHFATWALERTGNSQATVPIANGSSTVATGSQLGIWQTLVSTPNGQYTLRLTATDTAANSTVTTVSVTVGHFTAAQDVHQIDPTHAGRVRYTSFVPFALTEVLTIRNASGQAVKTLVNGLRQAGTHDDDWDGTDDAGQLVGNGAYRYDVTLTEGTSSMTWNEGSQTIGTGGATQLEYAQCRATSGAWMACDSAATNFDFDPYANKPLRVRYCVGSGNVPTCGASGPAYVVAKVTTPSETSGACDGGCFLSEYQATGAQEIAWYGMNVSGTFVAGAPRMTVIRSFEAVPKNMTLVCGMPVTISVLVITPLMVNPASGTVPGGQDYRVTVTTYGGRLVSLQAQFRNTNSNSVLRTLSIGPVAPGEIVIHWDGRADNGALVAPDLYEVIITATDSAGGTAKIKPLTIVRY